MKLAGQGQEQGWASKSLSLYTPERRNMDGKKLFPSCAGHFILHVFELETPCLPLPSRHGSPRKNIFPVYGEKNK